MVEVAIYKGDHLLIEGPIEQCADVLGVKVKSIKWHLTESAQKRKKLEKAKYYNRSIHVVVLDEYE